MARRVAKNPGIGRGGRVGILKPSERMNWIATWLQNSNGLRTNNHVFVEAYLKETGIKRSEQLSKDLLMMYEEGLVWRRQVRCGCASVYEYRWYRRQELRA